MYDNSQKETQGGNALRGISGMTSAKVPSPRDIRLGEQESKYYASMQDEAHLAQREPEILSAMNYSSRAIERLSDHVMDLNARLHPISRSVPPTAEPNKAAPSRQTELAPSRQTELAQSIQNQGDMISRIDSLVQQMMETIEI